MTLPSISGVIGRTPSRWASLGSRMASAATYPYDLSKAVVRPSYLDVQATAPLDPRVLDRMLPLMISQYGNPHSRTHPFGWEAEELVEEARERTGRLLNAKRPAREIMFTSGATESNNLVVKGVGAFYSKTGRSHAITTQLEHKCVLASMRWLEDTLGWDVTYLPVGKDGLVDVKELESAIRPGQTALVSVMHVNNEIGVKQPLKEIGDVLKKYPGVFFHSDCAQSYGKVPIDVQDMNLDMVSISGHKIYGPKGVGAVYVNSSKRPRVRLLPLISGGGQERGMRSGTIPTHLVVGLGEAAKVAEEEMENDNRHISHLAHRLLDGIQSRLPDVTLNGSLQERYHGNVNLSFSCVEGESLLMTLAETTALSSGSACTSASLEPSYVLRAIGVGDDLAHTSIRFGIGRFTTEEEIDTVVDKVVDAVNHLRDLSPLWEMKQQGITMDMEWT